MWWWRLSRAVGSDGYSTHVAEPIVWVVSGADPVGAAIATTLRAGGWRVAVSSGPDQSPSGGAVGPGAFDLPDDLAWHGDVDPCDEQSVAAAVAAMTDAIGAPTALVFNARQRVRAAADELDAAAFSAVVDASLLAAFITTKAVIGPMTRQRWGRLVYVADTVALHGLADASAYAAAQASLLGFARSLTRELGGRNITSNVVAPGPLAGSSRSAEEQAWYTELTPRGRLTEPADVAAAVQFLLSDDAGFVTGVFLPVDGGLAMGF